MLLGLLTGTLNVATARIVSALAGILMIYFTCDQIQQIYKHRKIALNHTSIIWARRLGIAIISSSYLWLSLTINCRVDMLFATLTSIAIFTAFNCIINDRYSLSDWIPFWLACGLATLTKGPLGLALPVFVVILYFITDYFTTDHPIAPFTRKGVLIFDRQIVFSLLVHITIGLTIFSLIALPWYGLAIMKGGTSFIEKQLLFENIKRISGGEMMNNQEWYYYLPNFFRLLFPWSFIYLAALIIPTPSLNLMQRNSTTPSVTLPGRILKFMHVWVIGTLVIFSIASGKRSSYLLPLLPGLTVAVVIYLVDLHQRYYLNYKSRLQNIAYFGSKTMLVLSLVVLTTLLFIYQDSYFFVHPQHNLIKQSLIKYLFYLLPVLASGCFLLWVGSNKPMISYNGIWCVIIALTTLALSVKNDLKGFEGQARVLNDTLSTLSPNSLSSNYSQQGRISSDPTLQRPNLSPDIYLVRRFREEYFDPLMYYIGRPLTPITPKELIPILLKRESDTFILGYQTELLLQLKKLNQLDVANNLARPTITQLVTVNQPLDIIKKKYDREIGLYKMTTDSSKQ
jgi:hypothetical protein